MPSLSNYTSTRDLIDAVRLYSPMREDQAEQGQRPDDPCLLRARPVMFVCEGSAVYLVRTDWKALTRFQRFSASILALFGLEPEHRYKLSALEASIYRAAMLFRKESGGDLLRTLDNVLRPPAPQKDTPSAKLRQPSSTTQAPLSAGTEACKAIISAFRPRVEAINAMSNDMLAGAILVKSATDETNVPNPDGANPAAASSAQARVAIPAAAASATSKALRRTLRQDVEAACQRAKLNASERLNVLHELGLSAVNALPAERIGRDPSHPAAQLAAARLRTLDYHLDQVPVKEPELAKCREIAIPDIHGNCLLLLHTLVSAGLVKIKDAAHWQAVCHQLDSLESDNADWNWRQFQRDLHQAITPVVGANDRKLTLQGDVLGDRVHCDMFMAIVLAEMDTMGLDYDFIMGNHDAEFLSYFLANRNRGEDEEYTMRGSGVGMDEEQARSLYRLNALLNQDRSARAPLCNMMDRNVMKHLKLVSTSRDGAVSFHHGVVNRALMEQLRGEARISTLLSARQLVDAINNWFHTCVLENWESFGRQYHFGKLNPAEPTTAFRAIACNIGVDTDMADEEMRLRRNAGTEPPIPGTKVAFHGHCPPPGQRIRNMLARSDDTIDTLNRLDALLDTTPLEERSHALRKVIRGLHAGSAFEVATFAGAFLAVMVRTDPQLKEDAKCLDLVTQLHSAPNIDSFGELLNELLKRIDEISGGGTDANPSQTALDWDAMPTAVREKLLSAVHHWLHVPSEVDLTKSLRDNIGRVIMGQKNRVGRVRAAIAENLPQSSGPKPSPSKAAQSQRDVHGVSGSPVQRVSEVTLTEKQLDAYLDELVNGFHSLEHEGGSHASHREFTRDICAIA